MSWCHAPGGHRTDLMRRKIQSRFLTWFCKSIRFFTWRDVVVGICHLAVIFHWIVTSWMKPPTDVMNSSKCFLEIGRGRLAARVMEGRVGAEGWLQRGAGRFQLSQVRLGYRRGGKMVAAELDGDPV